MGLVLGPSLSGQGKQVPVTGIVQLVKLTSINLLIQSLTSNAGSGMNDNTTITTSYSWTQSSHTTSLRVSESSMNARSGEDRFGNDFHLFFLFSS